MIRVLSCLLAGAIAVWMPAGTWAQGQSQLPDFSYQGRLERDGALFDGSADFQFSLWTDSTGGSQIGQTLFEPDYPVIGGLFTVQLAFPGAFTGEQRYLEVVIDGTVLPRQPVATTPVAQYALSGNAGPAGPAGPPGEPGPPGSTGQAAMTALGSGQLVLAAGAGYQLIPGLRQVINVPANASVYISTDGGAQHTLTGVSFSAIDVAVFINGGQSTGAGNRRVILSNTPAVGQMIGNWSMSLVQALPPGQHVIEVRASNPGPSPVHVSGTVPQVRGQLSLLVIRH